MIDTDSWKGKFYVCIASFSDNVIIKKFSTERAALRYTLTKLSNYRGISLDKIMHGETNQFDSLVLGRAWLKVKQAGKHVLLIRLELVVAS